MFICNHLDICHHVIMELFLIFCIFAIIWILILFYVFFRLYEGEENSLDCPPPALQPWP